MELKYVSWVGGLGYVTKAELAEHNAYRERERENRRRLLGIETATPEVRCARCGVAPYATPTGGCLLDGLCPTCRAIFNSKGR